jgi:hypothetical protein
MAWLQKHSERCCLTTITLSELRFGVERLAEGKRKRELDRKLAFLHDEFSDRILEFDEGSATEYGRYAADFEKLLGSAALGAADVRDLQIGAIARANGWIVASRNVRHFPVVETENPFVLPTQ